MTAVGAFDDALGRLTELFTGCFRRELVEELDGRTRGRKAFDDLIAGMRTHRWRAGARRIDLSGAIRELDDRTRRDGLHVLHDWDGLSGALSPDPIAVELTSLVAERRSAGDADPAALSMLFDYYALYLLALLSLRI